MNYEKTFEEKGIEGIPVVLRRKDFVTSNWRVVNVFLLNRNPLTFSCHPFMLMFVSNVVN